MGAIIQAKIFSRPRVELGKVIPLEVPFSIQIDICSACNMRCNFCFHSDLEAIKRAECKFGLMSYDLFKKIIDDMKESWGDKKVKKLKLFKVGEPLLNPEVCNMVRYAKESEVAECIEITSNGVLLNEELSLGLVEAGLDILNISVNGIDGEQYKETCNFNLDYDKFVKNIAFFYENKKQCRLTVKYSDIGYTKEQKDKFYSEFAGICDEMFVEVISATLWQDTKVEQTIENQHKGTYGQEIKKKEVCPFLFTTMVINDQGIAHLCCVDWKTEYIIGDLNKSSIKDVWFGERLRRIQMLHLNKKKDVLDICKNCESLSANTMDNIDGDAEKIIKKIYDKEN